MSALDELLETLENDANEALNRGHLGYSSAFRKKHDLATAELARLRRMADAYATGQLIQYGLCCFECNTGNGKHTATCDVAIHLDLPREKGEGE